MIEYFATADKTLYTIFQPLETISLSQNPFLDLVESIVNQQLSEKAGKTIFQRFIELFPNQSVTPEYLITIPLEELRQVGMSWNKAQYVVNVGRAVCDGSLDFSKLNNLPDEDVITVLTQIKGVGRWTAEMFLMFSLGREDVFSYGDVGLQNAIKKLYGFKKKPTQKQMQKISNKWKPYRTYACRVLWRYLDQKN